MSAEYRRRGVATALIQAAVEYARDSGGRIVEAYPIIPEAINEPRYQRYTGQLSTFEKVGFSEVARRSQRQVIVRYRVHDKDPEGKIGP